MSAMSIAQQLAAAELWLAGHWWLLFLAAYRSQAAPSLSF